VNVLGLIEEYKEELEAIGSASPPAPRWNQDWFPRLDAAAAYAMVRTLRPRRIVEVGSGHSTRFMARAVADGRLDTRITAVDPRPRADFRGLRVEHLAVPVQQAGRSPFDRLEKDDILFVDSSHQLKPGSDVEFLFGEVVPKLPAGVRVHFHDIFLPDDYPREWSWRRYNEQESVGLLLKNGAFKTEFSSHAIVSQHPEKIRGVLARLPLVPGAIESSLWLTKQ
jgi:Methyltransferase domain